MNNIRNLIGKNLKRIRKENCITQEELSAKLLTSGTNLDRPMISKIENQTREVTDIELVAIANVLSTSIDSLIEKSKDEN
ncbi:helix-turn-helix domain protein [Exiguobacterium sibiricum 255-15]|uniref:Helix-turn-helix domain protein n=1 Tax=Exiguobacterium sibiricum (strain DSM 17290 / CCUG 55495 / CIP 109462 / JCM 13490 / 255-15) TaxID=262543 RepID=B1YL24_EXIS2|nr:helix-turn-helix transcriptional regulator [Exiguobacterium sibiricum]ACB61826.1 helix-turn-helix domain protein [Exiguobacterium sibiricum 255-15]